MVICVDLVRLRQHLDYLDRERRLLADAQQTLLQSCLHEPDAPELLRQHLRFVQDRQRAVDARKKLLDTMIDVLSGAQKEITDQIGTLHSSIHRGAADTR